MAINRFVLSHRNIMFVLNLYEMYDKGAKYSKYAPQHDAWTMKYQDNDTCLDILTRMKTEIYVLRFKYAIDFTMPIFRQLRVVYSIVTFYGTRSDEWEEHRHVVQRDFSKIPSPRLVIKNFYT